MRTNICLCVCVRAAYSSVCVCVGVGGRGGPSCALSRVSLLEDRHGQTQNSRVQEAGGDGVGRLRPAVGRLISRGGGVWCLERHELSVLRAQLQLREQPVDSRWEGGVPQQ